MTASAMTAPGPQHLRALQRANEVRLARAELKRRVGSGERSVADIVLSTPWEAESMTISDLLTAQRRWGHTRCRRFLQGVPMSETKTIGSMTDRQRLFRARYKSEISPYYSGLVHVGVMYAGFLFCSAVFLSGANQLTRGSVVQHTRNSFGRTTLVVQQKRRERAGPATAADDRNRKACHSSSPNDSIRFW